MNFIENNMFFLLTKINVSVNYFFFYSFVAQWLITGNWSIANDPILFPLIIDTRTSSYIAHVKIKTKEKNEHKPGRHTIN